MSWILVLYIYAGVFAKGDSVTITSIPGFHSEQECAAAGTKAKPLVDNTAKDLHFVCLAQTK